MVERVIKCNRCGNKYPPEKMRYVQNIKNLMCLNCIEMIKSPKTEKRESKKDNIKKRFKCQKCKNTFMLKEKFNKQCPFCGGYDLINQEWNSDLNSLIEDSTNNIYDR
jgi:RNA polymerase subunit RPABC4/transcription elongation factor Spt4